MIDISETPPQGLRERVRTGRPLLLDSSMGTQLERRGVDAALPLWSARALWSAPEAVLRIHREDVEAGADILTANTFRTHRRTLEKENLGPRARELTRLAVELAREAARGARRTVFVVGSLSPLEDCYRPDLTPCNEALAREHAEQAAALAAAGVDGILAETHNTVRELFAAIRAARATGLPVIASMVSDGEGRLLSGESIEEAVRAVAPLRPDMLALNCVPARRLGLDLGHLARAASPMAVAAYGNATAFAGEASPPDYADLAAQWLAAGARLIGGCCGTTAEHTAALRRLLGEDAPRNLDA